MATTDSAAEDNPFYCPSLSATSFLENIRRQHMESTNSFDLSRYSDERPLPSFTELLDQSITADDLLELAYRPVLSDGSDHSGSIEDSPLLTPDRDRHDFAEEIEQECPLDTFSDLRGPAKRERSVASVNDASFELSGKASRLVYFPRRDGSPYVASRSSGKFKRTTARNQPYQEESDLHDRIKFLEAELYGAPVGTESPRGLKALLNKLDKMAPGIRLKERLTGLYGHQEVVDIMCSEGCITSRVLDVFRTSEIDSLDLALSLADESDLNIGARDLLQVLAKPNSFVFLTEVNFSGAPMRDADMACLQHLPRLSRLWLNSTGISNEAIFLLVPLKRSLIDLDVADNLGIDDDAVAAFLILRKLEFLAFSGTSITMAGVRRLARIAQGRKRLLEIELPQTCEEYLRKLNQKYLVNPAPPLATDPSAVSGLTPYEVLRNLAAHGIVNPSVGIHSTDYFLAKQLKELLEMREGDLCARKLLCQD